jgi:uncharacterized delta-60 repeat protein
VDRRQFHPRLEILEDRSLLNAGAIDVHFGDNGVATIDSNATVKGVAVEGDGKIVVLDQTQTGYDLIRLNTDGSLDTTFGSNGLVTATFGEGTTVVNLAVLKNGQIVVGGGHSSATDSYVDVASFNKDGTPETSFGGNGVAEVAFGGSGSASDISAGDMAVLPNGDIVVVGATGTDIAVIHLNADGSPQKGFGDNGVVTTTLGDSARATGVALQNDGKIVVTGFGNNELAVLRYSRDGSLDSHFGNGGIVSETLSGAAFQGSRVAIDSGGQIVVTADSFTPYTSSYNTNYGQDSFQLFRLNGDGSSDSGFGSQGQVSSSSWNYLAEGPVLHNLALPGDGKVLVAGNAYDPEVTRYNADGSTDLTYGNGGTATSWAAGWSSWYVPVLAVQSDGQVVLASSSTVWQNDVEQTNVVVSRFQAGGDLRPTPFGSEAALKEYLIDQAVQQYSWAFGRPFTYFWGIEPLEGDSAMGGPTGIAMTSALATPAASTSLSSNATATSNTFSQTNTQVQGVDEGDTVKTDGQYLYVLSGGQLVILNAWPADQLQIVSETSPPGSPIAEYLNGDRLTVISQEYLPFCATLWASGVVPWYYRSYPSRVDVTVYDISDRSAPTVVQQNTLDGNYDSSRAIGDTVYVAVNSNLSLPPPEYTETSLQPPAVASGGISIWFWGYTYQYETEASYRARMEAMSLEDLLPHYTTQWTDAGGSHQTSGLLATAANIYQPALAGDLNLMSVVAFNAGGSNIGPTQSVSFLTSSGATLYAATDNFYLLNSEWSYNTTWTLIDKLSLQDGGIDLTATGRVPGTFLNQFSVGEDGTYFDIATTTGWGTDASNNVYVLAPCDGTLDIIGKLEGLAPGERIYSVWFMGDVGFVSTFRRFDPLFTIDLSDPTTPRVAGSLEVAGYNSYLQPLDSTHLLGIGQDISPTTNEPTGFIVSIYDVSDLNNPALVSRYKVEPKGWSWSQATWDPHAITWYPQYQALTLPVGLEQYVPATDGGYDQWVSQFEQLVFHVDLSAGTLSLLGTVTDSSDIHRGVFINDVLYSISDSSVQAHSLGDLGTLIAQVQLPGPQYYNRWGGPFLILFPPLPIVRIDFPIVVTPVTPVVVTPVTSDPSKEPNIPWKDGSTGPAPVTDQPPVSQPTPTVQPPAVTPPVATGTVSPPSTGTAVKAHHGGAGKHPKTPPAHPKHKTAAPAQKAVQSSSGVGQVQGFATTIVAGLSSHGGTALPAQTGNQETHLSPSVTATIAPLVGDTPAHRRHHDASGSKKQGGAAEKLDTTDTTRLE